MDYGRLKRAVSKREDVMSIIREVSQRYVLTGTWQWETETVSFCLLPVIGERDSDQVIVDGLVQEPVTELLVLDDGELLPVFGLDGVGDCEGGNCACRVLNPGEEPTIEMQRELAARLRQRMSCVI